MSRQLRLGMVGGGEGAFIGGVHRMAARLDNRFMLVAGALSASPDKALASGQSLGLPPERTYTSFEEMAQAEAKREDGIEAVSVVTPNHVHADAATAFLSQGIHVICDKPLTSTLEDAERLADVAKRSNALFILTHNYSAYPMVRQARELVSHGDIGTVRIIQAEYPQDWLTAPAERSGNKQAEWRTDAARSGAGGSIGDIGTHAYHLACFVSGLEGTEVAADLHRFGPGRTLDDNAHILLRFSGGARGMLWSSQVAPGNDNALKLRIYGDKGGLEWAQEQPNDLWFTPFGKPTQRMTRAGAGATAVTRLPAGHPEGYLEAFATLYSEAAEAILAFQNGVRDADAVGLLPGISDGLAGMRFIDACVRSSAKNAAWESL